jgi:VanZ family protein
VTARRINFWLMVLWIFPGLPISFALRNSVPWIVFLSVYAIIATHNAGWRADVPDEEV